MKYRLSILGSLLAAAAFAVASHFASYSFIPVYTVGEVDKRLTVVELEIAGTAIVQSSTTSDKLLKIDEEGLYSFETTTLEQKMSVQGQEMENPNPSPVSTDKRTLYGEVLEQSGAEIPLEIAQRAARATALMAPTSPVEVGGKWSHEFKSSPKTGSVPASANFELLAEETVGSVETLKVKCSFKETEGTAPITAESIVWVRKDTFRSVKAESEVKNFPLPEGAPVSTVNVKIVVKKVD